MKTYFNVLIYILSVFVFYMTDNIYFSGVAVAAFLLTLYNDLLFLVLKYPFKIFKRIYFDFFGSDIRSSKEDRQAIYESYCIPEKVIIPASLLSWIIPLVGIFAIAAYSLYLVYETVSTILRLVSEKVRIYIEFERFSYKKAAVVIFSSSLLFTASFSLLLFVKESSTNLSAFSILCIVFSVYVGLTAFSLFFAYTLVTFIHFWIEYGFEKSSSFLKKFFLLEDGGDIHDKRELWKRINPSQYVENAVFMSGISFFVYFVLIGIFVAKKTKSSFFKFGRQCLQKKNQLGGERYG